MANPVFNRLESEWEQEARTPAGYPTMPGYRPGEAGTGANPRTAYADQAAAAQAARTAGAPTFDQRAMEQAYSAPAADAVDRGRMTYDDVIMKTGISFGLLVVAAMAAWWMTLANPGVGVALMGVGFLLGFVLAMVNIFSRTIRPALVLSYAAAEGIALGGLSAVFEQTYPGIVAQALVATVAVFGVTLALFASGRVRNSSKLTRFTLIALIGILVYRLLDWVLVLTGLVGTSTSNMTFMGIPLGVAVGLLAVLVGAAFIFPHLGRPERVFEMVTQPNFASPVFWDMVAIITYTCVTFVFFLLPLIPDTAILRGARACRARSVELGVQLSQD